MPWVGGLGAAALPAEGAFVLATVDVSGGSEAAALAAASAAAAAGASASSEVEGLAFLPSVGDNTLLPSTGPF